MTRAIIDLGSNSARMYLIQLRPGQGFTLLSKRRVMTRLSQGMGADRLLRPEPMARTIAVLKQFAQAAKEAGAEICAAATAAVRTAANCREFCQAVLQETGIRLWVISGEQEAALDFQGVLAGLPQYRSFLITDTGGGSTELILVENRTLAGKVSLPFGAVNLYETYGAGPESLGAAAAALRPKLTALPLLRDGAGLPLVGLGGSLTALGRLSLSSPADQVHGHALDPAQVHALYDRLAPMTPAARIDAGVEPGRADTICYGILPTLLLLDVLHSPRLILSTAGLREGIIQEMLTQGPNFNPENWEHL